MADPHGSNITEADAARFDRTMPPGLRRLDIAERLRQARIDMDALVAGVTNASVKAALATGGATLDLGGSTVTDAGAITSTGTVAANSVTTTIGIGMHGEAAPAAKSAKIADGTDLPTTMASVAEIIDVLELYGLSAA
jgi:hypothetical protein